MNAAGTPELAHLVDASWLSGRCVVAYINLGAYYILDFGRALFGRALVRARAQEGPGASADREALGAFVARFALQMHRLLQVHRVPSGLKWSNHMDRMQRRG